MHAIRKHSVEAWYELDLVLSLSYRAKQQDC